MADDGTTTPNLPPTDTTPAESGDTTTHADNGDVATTESNTTPESDGSNLETNNRGRVYKGEGQLADGIFVNDKGSNLDAANPVFDFSLSTPPITEEDLFGEGSVRIKSATPTRTFQIQWRPASPENQFQGRNGNRAIAICNHIMEGTLGATASWFANPNSEASTHFGIGKDGTILQFVRIENGAYGNGPINKPDLSVSWIAECVNKKINPNFVTISIEHEGKSGEAFTEDMYGATLWLHRYLISNFNIPVTRQNIIGHYQLDSVTRPRCPGTGFPWDRLMQDLGANTTAPAPAAPTGTADTDIPGRIAAAFGPGTVNTPGAYIRKRPGFGPEAAVLRKATKGTVLRFIGYSDAGPAFQGGMRWYQISDADDSGWIHSMMIS